MVVFICCIMCFMIGIIVCLSKSGFSALFGNSSKQNIKFKIKRLDLDDNRKIFLVVYNCDYPMYNQDSWKNASELSNIIKNTYASRNEAIEDLIKLLSKKSYNPISIEYDGV